MTRAFQQNLTNFPVFLTKYFLLGQISCLLQLILPDYKLRLVLAQSPLKH